MHLKTLFEYVRIQIIVIRRQRILVGSFAEVCEQCCLKDNVGESKVMAVEREGERKCDIQVDVWKWLKILTERKEEKL